MEFDLNLRAIGVECTWVERTSLGV